jgi:putative copper export protein
MNWGALAAILVAGLLVWLVFRYARQNPQAFSKQNMAKSFSTMGVLALLLIGFVAFCIMLLNSN